MNDSVPGKNTNNLKPYNIIIAIVTVVIVILAVLFFPKSVPFWPFNVSDILILLVSLFLISLFIERTVEVVMIVWREKSKQQLVNELNAEKKKSEQIAKGSRDITSNEEQATKNLNNYNAETKTFALPTAFALGIIISALGIRTLQPLIDPAIYKTFPSLQKALFTGADTLITGALLGGGSKGIHEIIEAFLNTVEKYRTYIKKDKK